jgi:hypothetical protein
LLGDGTDSILQRLNRSRPFLNFLCLEGHIILVEGDAWSGDRDASKNIYFKPVPFRRWFPNSASLTPLIDEENLNDEGSHFLGCAGMFRVGDLAEKHEQNTLSIGRYSQLVVITDTFGENSSVSTFAVLVGLGSNSGTPPGTMAYYVISVPSVREGIEVAIGEEEKNEDADADEEHEMDDTHEVEPDYISILESGHHVSRCSAVFGEWRGADKCAKREHQEQKQQGEQEYEQEKLTHCHEGPYGPYRPHVPRSPHLFLYHLNENKAIKMRMDFLISRKRSMDLMEIDYGFDAETGIAMVRRYANVTEIMWYE